MDREKSVDGQELIRLINGHSEHIKKCTITCATTVAATAAWTLPAARPHLFFTAIVPVDFSYWLVLTSAKSLLF